MAKEPTILVKQEDGTSVRMTLAEFTLWRDKRVGSGAVDEAPQAVTQNSPTPAVPSAPPVEADDLPEIDAPAKKPEPKTEKAQTGDEPIAGMFLPKEEQKTTKAQEEKKMKDIDPELPPPEKPSEPSRQSAPPKVSTPKNATTQPVETSPKPEHVEKKLSLAEQLYRQSQSKPTSASSSSAAAQPAPPARPSSPPTTTVRKPGVDPVSTPPPRQAIMGPVDEFAVINLADFRRMSAQPAEAAKRLKEKFMTLQDESYLMYLDGVEAWKGSPLYKQYQGVLVGALEAGQPLDTYLSTKDEMTLADMEALADLNSSLL